METTIKRTFETTQLLEWGIHNLDDCEYVVHVDELGADGYESLRRVVFRAPDDAKLWQFEYEYSNGACYDDMIGTSDPDDPKPERPSFEATLVEPRLTVATVYKPVFELHSPHVELHASGLLSYVDGRAITILVGEAAAEFAAEHAGTRVDLILRGDNE